MGIAWASTIGTVMLREQAHHKSGSAVATLRATVVDHRLLDSSQLAFFRQRFHSVDLLSRGHRQQHQTAIHRTISADSAMLLDHHHSTGAAFTFGATFFGSGKTARAQKVQQSGVQLTFDPHTFAVEKKLDRSWAGLRV